MSFEIGDGSVAVYALSDIKVGVNITNIRTVFSEESIKELAESIYEDGLINPIVVMETEHPDSGEDIVELVCGARRMRAIQYILSNFDADWGDGEVKCTLFEGGIVEAELLNGVENIEREEVDPVDTSDWIYRMVEENGHTQADLAKKLHKSPTWVSNRFSFAHKASPELRDAVREGIINFTAASVLASKMSHEEQAKRVKQARKHNTKITLEQAQAAGDPDRVARPSKKKRDRLQALAEKLANENPGLYRNAHGAAMALRFVDGALTESEMEEVLKWDQWDHHDKKPAAEGEESADPATEGGEE